MSTSQDPEVYFAPALDVFRKAFRAMLTGDLSGLAAHALPDPDLELLTKNHFVPKYDLPALDASIEQMQIEPASNRNPEITDTRLDLQAMYRGAVLPVTLVLIDGQWKVDCRWWLAAKRPDGDEERTARAFLYGLMTVDPQLIAQSALPHPMLHALTPGHGPPAGEHGQYEHIIEATAFIRAAPGESYVAPDGQNKAVRADQVSENRVFLLALIPATPDPLALPVVRHGDQWRVDAQEMIEQSLRH